MRTSGRHPACGVWLGPGRVSLDVTIYDNRIYYANPTERRFKVLQRNDSKCYKRLGKNVLTDQVERLFWMLFIPRF